MCRQIYHHRESRELRNCYNVVLQGIDFSTHVEIAKPLTWDFKYAMLRARNTDADDWLIRMPADKIENELSLLELQEAEQLK